MATVTGVTAARAASIEAQLIVGATKSGTTLIFTKANGETIQIADAFPKIIDSYPVNSIYMSTSPSNPSTYMGGGTWIRWGKGRVPVSVDEAQTEFDAAEETGGTKTETLTVAQLPSHDHGGATGGQSADHTHAGYTDVAGGHAHNYFAPAIDAGATGGSSIYRNRQAAVTDTQGAHSHAVATYGASNGHYHGITAQGGGQAHNNLQPYITCYMWKRTA